MGKSLAETAKSILTEEGVPSVSPMDLGHPDRDAKSTTLAKSSLRPGKTERRFANPNATSEGDLDDVEDLGGATPTSTAKENLGAKASGRMKKDSSRPTQSAAPAESGKKLDEDVEISEELEDFILGMMEEGYSEDEIAEAIEENFEFVTEAKDKDEDEDEEYDDEEEDDEDDEDEDDYAERSNKMSMKKMMKEHVDALLSGENLSEEFRVKAETIFESAVNIRVNEELQIIEETFAQSLEEEVKNIHETLTQQVDDYLNYVVEQWVSKNEVAIESGLRTELTEDFISGLKNLFAEHYMDIPDEKVSVVEELARKVENLETKLNEEIDRNVSLTSQINESRQFEVLYSACEGLTSTQAEKLKSLAENISFTNVEEFAEKIETLKESYFSNNNVSNNNVLDNVASSDSGMILEDSNNRMSAYVKVLGKSLPK